MDAFEIRFATEDEWEKAMATAWKSFNKFVAPEYSELGVREFYDFISDNGIYKMFLAGEYKLWVAVADGEIVGMISIRSKRHISLLFVDGKYHKQGVGRALINTAKDYVSENNETFLSVNASPYGVGFYHKIGFEDTGEETVVSGMRITPMIWKF